MKLKDVEQLPAYAVYKNLIPGVKVYQDSSKQTPNKKDKSKNNNSQGNGVAPSQVAPHQNQKAPETISSETSKKRKKQRKRKRKSKEIATEEQEIGLSKRLKSVQDELNPQLLPNPFAHQHPKSETSPKQLNNKKDTPAKTKSITTNGSPLSKSPMEHQDIPKGKKSNKNGHVHPNEGLKAEKEKKLSISKKSLNESVPKANATPSLTPKSNENKDTPSKKTKNQLNTNKKQISPLEKAIVPIQNRDTTSLEDEEEILIEELLSSRNIDDSVEHGKNLFQWLISPTPVTEFMSNYWEKAPLHVKRFDTNPDFYKWILTSAKLDDILRKNLIRYGKNVDITSYTDGERQTHNPVGRAMPAAVWDYYSNGCSVRFLNPQTYAKPLWRLNASMQEYFGTFVGANVYLTPPDSQGFAPHYDDIEAFILQVEGRKHWKLYKPRTPEEELPRVSSGNFSEDTDNLGEPILDVVLEEGDLLYFPRGMIHQAKAVDEHSLHITISCYQNNTWGDLLKEYLSSAVDHAMANSVEFRRGLPTDYLSFMGVAHQDNPDKQIVKKRKSFMGHSKKLIQQLVEFTTPDLAADQLGKKFMWDSLPPYITLEEKKTSTLGDGEFMDEGKVYNRCEFDPDIEVKLVRKNCIRLVCEENVLRVYFTVENSMEYHGEEPQFVEISLEAEKAIKLLIASYPNFVKIDDLPLKSSENRIQLITDLWERGIVVTKERLSPLDDDEIPTFDDDDFIDDVDIGSDSSEEVAEFCEDGSDYDDDEDEDSGRDYIDDEAEEVEDEEEEDSDDDGSDMIDLSMDSFDDFVERAMSDGDEEDDEEDEDENGLGKSYIEEVSDDEKVPQLVQAKPIKNSAKVAENKKVKRQSINKKKH